MTIYRALVSVSDKTGVVEFAKGLQALGVQILSTGGTAKALRDAGVKVQDVSDYTGFPEMMDGRVKTLHPKVHGGILAIRASPEHAAQAKAHGIEFIDLVAVNLYPFEKTIAKQGVQLADAVENIDIGGPAMIRSAAKNFAHVAVVCNPARYPHVLSEMKQNSNQLSQATREALSAEAFSHTASYDAAISNFLKSNLPGAAKETEEFPQKLVVSFEKAQSLRYGENPHQKAAFYKNPTAQGPCVSNAKQLQGKELSYNNILDADAAIELEKEFSEPACVIVKHTNPCGAGSSPAQNGLEEAYGKALATDPTSAFGGIICLNREVEKPLAEKICTRFYEIIIAPSFSPAAKEVFAKKQNLRLLELPGIESCEKRHELQFRSVSGGVLVQDRDIPLSIPEGVKTASVRAPTGSELNALMFAWKVAKHVKSNAIVYALEDRTIGIGAGQMSRVDSARLGIMKAKDAGLSVKGTVMASDAFFPFRDAVDAAAEAGVTAIIQPGGSIKDAEVIAAADEHELAMLLTGMRHFKH